MDGVKGIYLDAELFSLRAVVPEYDKAQRNKTGNGAVRRIALKGVGNNNRAAGDRLIQIDIAEDIESSHECRDRYCVIGMQKLCQARCRHGDRNAEIPLVPGFFHADKHEQGNKQGNDVVLIRKLERHAEYRKIERYFGDYCKNTEPQKIFFDAFRFKEAFNQKEGKNRIGEPADDAKYCIKDQKRRRRADFGIHRRRQETTTENDDSRVIEKHCRQSDEFKTVRRKNGGLFGYCR